MSNEDFSHIATFLAANPGSIATEIGVSPVEMGRLEKAGKVIRIGKRTTGSRGRPPVEWALPGTEGVVNDDRVTEAVERAKAKVEAADAYWAISNKLWMLRERMGWKAAQEDEGYIALLVERKALCATFPEGKIPQPTVTDLVLAGRIEAPPVTHDEDDA